MKMYQQLRYWMAASVFAAAALTAGCGGGGSGGNVEDTQNGEVVIGLTDADGDFLGYVVDVTSLRLEHQDGRIVETMTEGMRIDFSQYVDLTELLAVATIPHGRYVGAEIRFDYSNAQVLVESSGAAVAAKVVDADGDALESITLRVSFDGDHPLVVAPGVSKFLTLDFDLETGNSVDMATTPPTVTVEPVLVADVDMKVDKETRLRGLLQSVDTDKGVIAMNLRPGHVRQSRFGQVDVYVNGDTDYDINGTEYSGAAGLTALAARDQNTWLLVKGRLKDVDGAGRAFVATDVRAGRSVLGGDTDGVIGVVTARNATSLTVKARVLWLDEGDMRLNQTVTVTPDGDTQYSKQDSDANVSLVDISVGQRVELLGDLASNMTMAPERIRLLLSGAAGTAVSLNSAEVTLDLSSLSGRPVADYDFSGTGSISVNDADPNLYQVDATGLSLSGMNVGNPLRVRGFVAPFGSAPADFDATKVIDLSQVDAQLVLKWRPAESGVITQIETSQLVFDLSGVDRAQVRRHDYVVKLTTAQTPTIAAPSNGSGLYALQKRGQGTRVYRSFDAFVAALTRELTAANKVSKVMAKGRYNDATNTLVAEQLHIKLK